MGGSVDGVSSSNGPFSKELLNHFKLGVQGQGLDLWMADGSLDIRFEHRVFTPWVRMRGGRFRVRDLMDTCQKIGAWSDMPSAYHSITFLITPPPETRDTKADRAEDTQIRSMLFVEHAEMLT